MRRQCEQLLFSQHRFRAPRSPSFNMKVRVFVRWEDPSAKTCRLISLDKFHRVIYNGASMIRVISVLGCRLVVADTGAQMIQGTGPPRHHMLMWCFDTQQAQEANNLDGQVSTSHSVVREVSLGAVVAHSDVYRCKQCANDFHSTCAQKIDGGLAAS